MSDEWKVKVGNKKSFGPLSFIYAEVATNEDKVRGYTVFYRDRHLLSVGSSSNPWVVKYRVHKGTLYLWRTAVAFK